MTENTNQLYCLLKLTWEGCGNGIRNIFVAWAGMMIFIFLSAVFFCLNIYYNVNPYLDSVPPTIVMSPDFGQILTAAEVSVINAFSLLTFLTITICLFTFAFEFAYVCYYYDNCSWAIPNAIINLFRMASKGFDYVLLKAGEIVARLSKVVLHTDRTRLAANRKYETDRRNELRGKIKDIKKSDWL